MMPFDPRGGAEGGRRRFSGITFTSPPPPPSPPLIGLTRAHTAPSCRAERERERGGRRALNLVNVCAVQVCRAGERDGMLTRAREGREGRGGNGEI